MSRLQTQEDTLSQEQRRQLELARLRREQRRAQHEDKFDAAALVLGMTQKEVR